MPHWTLASPQGDGPLRINLPSASATGVSDGEFGEGPAVGFHVVRAPKGGMFVDFTARRAFRYRALALADPARLVVDFERGGPSPYKPPPAAEETVLVEPRPGDEVSDPLAVSGYSCNFGASDTIVLETPGRERVRKTVTGNDWSRIWGYFEAPLDLPPFSGTGLLLVGAAGAGESSLKGSRSRLGKVSLPADQPRDRTKCRGSSGSPVARRTVSRQFSRAPGPKKDSRR